MTYMGGYCGNGVLNTTVFVEGGQDVYWTYLVVAHGAGREASALGETDALGGQAIELPALD